MERTQEQNKLQSRHKGREHNTEEEEEFFGLRKLIWINFKQQFTGFYRIF